MDGFYMGLNLYFQVLAFWSYEPSVTKAPVLIFSKAAKATVYNVQ